MIENSAVELTVNWQSDGLLQTAHWHSESGSSPPKSILLADDTTNAQVAYKKICEGASFLYTGDFQNAKQLLNAITRKADNRSALPAETLTQVFHQHRARQIQRANLINRVLIEFDNGQCNLKRAPQTRDAVEGALESQYEANKIPHRLIMSLRELLGMIGAHEWRKKGVWIESLAARVHAHYGVYSPIRGEYLELINKVDLHNAKTAVDIGTGTGVIAAILVKRGVQSIIAIDNSPRAIRCAQENIERLNLKQSIKVEQAELFPSGLKTVDLIVCNPPWLPVKANAPIEHAIYDPNSQMLKGFLGGVSAHLNADGQAWLIMSNLAELLGLRASDQLQQWIFAAGLTIIQTHSVAPTHTKAYDPSDPLYAARAKEITSLYQLKKTS